MVVLEIALRSILVDWEECAQQVRSRVCEYQSLVEREEPRQQALRKTAATRTRLGGRRGKLLLQLSDGSAGALSARLSVRPSVCAAVSCALARSSGVGLAGSAG